MEREEEIQELCKAVLTASPNTYYNPNGADETTCPFCYAKDYQNNCVASMDDINHDVNCAYNIAKGLSANLISMNKALKYKPGQSQIFIDVPNHPKNTSGYVGHVDDKDGLFIEWDKNETYKIVLRKDGKDNKQTFDEFIANCKTK